MQSITIPSGVTTIEDWSFSNCTNLESIYLKCQTPPNLPHEYDTRYTFYDNAEKRKFYVQRSSLSAYKSSDDWSEYVDYIEGYDF